MRAVMVKRGGGSVGERLVINESGGWEKVVHHPWLYVYGIDIGEETGVDFYIYNNIEWRYVRAGKARLVKVREPRHVRRVAEIIERHGGRHSMSNIRYEARLSMDYADRFHGIKVPIPLYYGFNELEPLLEELRDRMAGEKILAFDIEVASSTGGFPRPGDRVFIVSFSDGEESWVLESEEVCEFAREVRRVAPSFLFGFNSEAFDIPYLRAYCGLGVLDAAGIWDPPVPHIDLMKVLNAHGSAFGLPQGKRMALDDVALALGLAGREEAEIESSVDRARIWEEYRRDPGRVLRYAEVDALLTAKLARYVYPVLAVLYTLTGIAPNVIQQLPTLGSLSEYSVMDIVRRRYGRVYEVRNRRYDIRGLKGYGVVYSNKYKDMFTAPMVLEDVAEYDFNMLYPSIYTRYELDPEGAVIGEGFAVPLLDGDRVVWVRLSSRGGPVSETLKYFYHARKATKALKKRGWEAPDQAVKILANSAYGMFSKGRGMGLHEALAGFIFFKANEIMDTVVKWLESRGYRVVYTATDSLFVLGVNDPERLQEEINQLLAATYGPEFSVKLEARIKRLALIKKKTYVFIDSDGGVVVKGMEKLQIPRAVKDNLEDVFKAELEDGKGLEKLREIISTARSEDLYVRTSKSLRDALWDTDEARWKTLNNNGSRAVLVTYLLYTGAQDKRVCPDQLDDYTIVARWLGGGSRLLVLHDSQQYLVSVKKIAVRSGCLEVSARIARVNVPRRRLEALAWEKSQVVVDYLKTIKGVVSVVTL